MRLSHRLSVGLLTASGLVFGLTLQFRILPSDVWETTWPSNVLAGNQTIQFSISQGHLVEGKPGEFKIRFSDPVEALEAPYGASWNADKREFNLPVYPRRSGVLDYEMRVFPNKGPEARIFVSLDVSPSYSHRLWLSALLAVPVLALELGIYYWIRSRRRRTRELEAKVASAEIKAEKEPEKARPAWILAQTKLEAYFDRNLQQVNQVFVVAIGVMIVGFCFVLTGVVMSIHQERVTAAELVASGAGVITEFIGATFMVIYRSTMAQANEFMSVLERINTVGMAVQVLDSMPDADPKLKDETRAHMIELLLLTNVSSKTRDRKSEEHSKKRASMPKE